MLYTWRGIGALLPFRRFFTYFDVIAITLTTVLHFRWNLFEHFLLYIEMESCFAVVGHVAGEEFPEMWRRCWLMVYSVLIQQQVGLKGVLSSWLKQAKYVTVMFYFIFRCRSWGGGETTALDGILANSFKMAKSSRSRYVSKYGFSCIVCDSNLGVRLFL